MGCVSKQVPRDLLPSSVIHSIAQERHRCLGNQSVRLSEKREVPSRSLLFIPARVIHFAPTHSLWYSINDNTGLFQALYQVHFSFHWSAFGFLDSIKYDSSSICIPISALQLPLNACDEVKVMVDAGRCCKFAPGFIYGWIADATALSP